MLVLDELPLVSLLGPDGRIDATRYPNFAALAGGSTWYRNATGVSGWTPYALPAMLTGRYPSTPAAPHYSQYPDNLFTALGGLYDIRGAGEHHPALPAQPLRAAGQPPSRGSACWCGRAARCCGRIAAPVDSRVDPEESFREQTAAEAGLDAAEPVPADPKFRWDSLDDNQPARFTSFLAGLRPADPADPALPAPADAAPAVGVPAVRGALRRAGRPAQRRRGLGGPGPGRGTWPSSATPTG